METQAVFDVVETKSPQQTQKLAQKIADNLCGSEVIALYGQLGSGKTVFVQGLAKTLGIKARIVSPTFIFLRSYPFVLKNKKLIFHHVDLYRTESLRDYQSLGLEELFSKDSIVAIEWAEKIKRFLPQKRIDVVIEVIDKKTRRIKTTPPPVILTSSGARGKDLKRAVEIFKKGGVVIFPTDTVYGIGCRFDDQSAISRIYRIKKTPKNQKFPVLVSNINQLKKIARVTKTAEKLIGKYWPGGLTIILYHKPGLRSGKKLDYKPGLKSGKIGFRMPDSDLIRFLIGEVGVPLIGTSANFHGQKSVTRFKDLDPKLVKLVDMTISGECQKGVESTVVDATVTPPKILRQGAVKLLPKHLRGGL